MYRKQLLLLITIVIIQLSVYGQDPQFSQYFSSPLTLNPANTGGMSGVKRLAANFRNQWQGIGNPYLTGTFSFESQILKKRMGEGNKLAIGFLGLFDKTIGGAYKSNYFSTSVGYHLWLNEDMTDKLSIGFQTTLVNRTLDYNNLSFAEQFVSGGFNTTLSNNQTFINGSINYFDFNTGLLYAHITESMSYYFGSSIYHITQPVESFLSKNGNKLPIRLTLNGGAVLNAGEVDRLHLSALWMSQGSVSQAVFGAAYELVMPGADGDRSLMLGSYYRMKDAFIPYVGIKLKDMQIGISYDATISSLNLGKTKNRSFEVSLLYNFPDNSQYKKYVPWY